MENENNMVIITPDGAQKLAKEIFDMIKMHYLTNSTFNDKINELRNNINDIRRT